MLSLTIPKELKEVPHFMKLSMVVSHFLKLLPVQKLLLKVRVHMGMGFLNYSSKLC